MSDTPGKTPSPEQAISPPAVKAVSKRIDEGRCYFVAYQNEMVTNNQRVISSAKSRLRRIRRTLDKPAA